MVKLKLIAKGAEANLYLTKYCNQPCLLKRREEKKYRISELDLKLRKRRTKNEANLLHAAKNAGVLCPLVYGLSDFEIYMQYVRAYTMRDLLHGGKLNLRYLITLGSYIACLHINNIVHGDFTTANVLIKDGKVWVIDFGLGSFSRDLEDKAVDLLLMKTSLENKILFNKLLSGYSKIIPIGSVTKQMAAIEKRARYVVRAMKG